MLIRILLSSLPFLLLLSMFTTEAAGAEVLGDTAPTVLSVTLNPDSIPIADLSNDIDATVHVTDDLSGVTYIYLNMRPLHDIRRPGASGSEHSEGSCTLDPAQLDATCILRLPLMLVSDMGVWGIETLIVRDGAGNERTYFHPTLPSAWDPDTLEITEYACQTESAECLPDHLSVTFEITISPMCAMSGVADPRIASTPDGPTLCGRYEIRMPLILR